MNPKSTWDNIFECETEETSKQKPNKIEVVLPQGKEPSNYC